MTPKQKQPDLIKQSERTSPAFIRAIPRFGWRETNSNFGFNLPWWDRLCGTCRAQPEAGHGGMTIGLKEFRDPRRLTLFRLLIQPFLR
jgi:hypothetical protein